MQNSYIDLRTLRHIVALARHLNFSRAAEELGLSQPALSRSIQVIEARAEAKLFDRDRGQVRLTQLGRHVVTRAIGMVKDAEHLEHTIERFSDAQDGEISFGLAPLPARVFLAPVLIEGVTERPRLRSHITVAESSDLMDKLVTGDIEFCVTPERMIDEGWPIKGTFIGHFPLSLLVRSGHPLLSENSRSKLTDFPLIGSGAQAHPDLFPMRIREIIPMSPHIVLNDYDTLSRVTQESDAIWLSSTFAALNEIQTGLISEYTLPGGRILGNFRVMMYSAARRSPSPAAIILRKQFQLLMKGLLEDSQAVD